MILIIFSFVNLKKNFIINEYIRSFLHSTKVVPLFSSKLVESRKEVRFNFDAFKFELQENRQINKEILIYFYFIIFFILKKKKILIQYF